MSTNRIIRLLVSGAVLALTVAVMPATAQQDDPRLERIRGGLPDVAVEQIERRVAEARAQGLPFEVLLDKAVEGIAKGVPAPRVAGAVDRLAQELGTAQGLLGNGRAPDPTDISAVADALRRGVPEGAIRRIAQQAGPDETIALAVHTLGDLMDRGVPVEEAVAVLEAWRYRGGRPDELREITAAVERLMRQGVLPGQAAAALANAIRSGHPGSGQIPGGGQQGPGMSLEGGPPIPPGSGPPSDRERGGPPGGGETGPTGGG